MSKNRQRTTAASIARRIKEGRGKGHFGEYKPWLTIHDVPSQGVVTRVPGWKSGRIHHYLSEHFELAHHYQMEWAPNICDIREQYPLLPLEKTLFIAEKLGINHPVDPKTKYPIVMTTDMLLTIRDGDELRFVAHSIKPASKINRRVLEKLQIEQSFFKDAGIGWRLITENQINYDLVKNIEWLHSARSLEDNSYLTKELINKLEPILYEAIQNKNKPLAKITLELDEIEELPQGTCMNAVRYLIANRLWEVDLSQRFVPTLQSLKVLNNLFQKGECNYESIC